jgi:hypothetical protein
LFQIKLFCRQRVPGWHQNLKVCYNYPQEITYWAPEVLFAMINSSDWQEMKQKAFESFANDGRMDVAELEQIVQIGCADGEFDEQEKAVLINVISSLTRADMNDTMWAKVDELIQKFELEEDKEASIEDIDDEQDI